MSAAGQGQGRERVALALVHASCSSLVRSLISPGVDSMGGTLMAIRCHASVV